MYKLIATNDQGASVIYRGDTKSEVINDFDRTFERSGFTIEIYNTETGKTIQIKKTHR